MHKQTLPVLFALLAPTLSFAEYTETHRESLFNGENLNGWHVTGCETAVEDGNLVIQDGDGFVRSDHRYRDFVLELKWRARKKQHWDSGIYFRCDLPPEDRPWPKRYQVNLLQGQEGNLVGNKQATSKGLVVDGDWNHFKLTVIGSQAELEINGKPAWKADGIEQTDGYIGMQSEVPGGGQFEFKDIFVTELTHRPLFNGEDLSGWEGGGRDASLCWKVEDGALICTGEKGPWLRSQEPFDDFNLRLEYKLKEGGNSGVYLRVPKTGARWNPGDGAEIQILDDRAKRYKKLKDSQYGGSLYKIAASREHVGREPGKWNSLEIDCLGYSYRVVHNGVTIVEANAEEFPAVKERRLKGFLGLQNHSEEVCFRNLRVGPSLQNSGHGAAGE